MTKQSEKNPNPQGKGVVAILSHWQASRPSDVRAKAADELLLDLFTSTLVLSAEFGFRPVLGQRYYLYLRGGDWRLSLIGPGEWGDRSAGRCLGECQLRTDMTWSVDAQEALACDFELRATVAELLEDFMRRLDNDAAFAEQFPGYRSDLPYYRRLYATGLTASLRRSLNLSDSDNDSARVMLLAGAEGMQLRLENQAPSTDNSISSL